MKKFLLILLLLSLVLGGIYISLNKDLINNHKNTALVSEPIKPVLIEQEIPSEPEPEITQTKLFFVGDIMLSRSVGKKMDRENDYTWPFIHIAPYLRQAEIVFGNLENPVSDKGRNVGSIYSFRANPQTIQGLSLSGFNALSIANNHIGDWTREAAQDTLDLFDTYGIHAVGGGMNKKEAHSARTITHKDTTFGFLAYSLIGPHYIRATESKAGITTPSRENMIADIEHAKEISDVVIVSLHFGEEYETEANQYQKDLARSLVDVGAKLVIGHHPHVLQPGEFYKDGYIAYSLGNFVFDQHFSEETQTSAILEIIMEEGEIVSATETPVRITTDYQVILDPEL